MTLRFSHRKSPTPPKSPRGPTQSVGSIPPMPGPSSDLLSHHLPITLLRPLRPFCLLSVLLLSTLPGMPFPQTATRLMPSPSSSLHATVTSPRPTPSLLFTGNRVTLAAPAPELAILRHIRPGSFFFFFHSTCYLLTFDIICWGF